MVALCDRHPGESTARDGKRPASRRGKHYLGELEAPSLTNQSSTNRRPGPLIAFGLVLQCRSRNTGAVPDELNTTFNPQAHRDGTVARPWHGLFYVLSRGMGLIDALPDRRRQRCDATQPATRSYPTARMKYLTFLARTRLFQQSRFIAGNFGCHRCHFRTVS